jgi:hypothetical protein
MIKPDKHTNPALSVINIAGLIVNQIKNNEVIEYNVLLSNLIDQTSVGAKEVFNYSLSFLYLLDKIEYISGLDALRLKK